MRGIKVLSGCFAVVIILLIIGMLLFVNTPSGRASWNFYWHDVQKADDSTRYQTRKEVEDTCRATIVSYEADKLTWEQYKDSESDEQRRWADAAKLRANKAAITYNEYFLKNSYVFEDNIPEDIRENLELLE